MAKLRLTSVIVIVTFFSLSVVSPSVLGLQLQGQLGLNTTSMAYMNSQIKEVLVRSGMGSAKLGLSTDIQAVVQAPLGGLDLIAGGRFLQVGLHRGNIQVSSSAIGAYLGWPVEFYGFHFQGNLGIYSVSFSAPKLGYAGLSGTTFGAQGLVSKPVGSWAGFNYSAGLRMTWLPVNSLQDKRGGTVSAPNQPLLNYSGVGLYIKITWNL